ncbi:MAG TPA: SDR family NAD(P)-dependent oxidoreductase [Acidimicrobiia bacterium]|nr:SDR family NAD(P)-dependent oxidoreductase [Acidimicrobiia bacterium]
MTALKDRVVVVTGAGAGVGRAVAREFGERGPRVGLIGRDPSRLAAAAGEIAESGGTAVAVPGDVADADHMAGAAARVEEMLGPIDVWVNNADASTWRRTR